MSVKFWRKPVDFFARRVHFLDHMLPIWEAMDIRERGKFYVPECMQEYAHSKGIDVAPLKSISKVSAIQCAPDGTSPLLVAAYGDLVIAHKKSPQRPLILMEHGVGLTPSNENAGYAGGTGMRRQADLFLAPNQLILAKTKKAIPDTPQVVVGTPKMDKYSFQRSAVSILEGTGDLSLEIEETRKPVVCISFHWNGNRVSPEASNAFLHYRDVLDELANQPDFTLIGHGHPKYMFVLEPEYRARGIEVVQDFEVVMERADVYVNDCSSTLYEFCVTGKPVVIMNAPWFRKEIHFGIRFWEYADIGPQVEGPEELLSVISDQLSVISGQANDEFACARKRMIDDLYPYLGCAAQRAAGAILGFAGGKHG